ncbi:hypothetical protein [Azospirillum thermophilum]|uniref:Uncharacterized protein n=1 Tax=Azospirillum thermophilum TaxID=2202148 RepID=A0A2S2CSP8_9PROT|nr:hypothetical protein [Azospirillum thermophilum]AWK87498.1 hypothetical protein DEW08_15870 [Azospirillum thermophilum]
MIRRAKNRLALSLCCLAALAACDATDRAVFVTSTSIGLNADATTRQVGIAYDRSEGFIGPDYVDDGAVPSAVGYLDSDLEVFSPKIRQLYATGAAADIVTGVDPAAVPPDGALTGTRRLLAFGTATTLGLQVGFATASGLPDALVLGYRRKEASVIPFRKADPTSGQPDSYAPVLASITMNQTTGTLDRTGTRLVQFIATGRAARALAADPQVRSIFDRQGKQALSLAQLDAVERMRSAGATAGCFLKPDRTVDQAELQSALAGMQAAGVIPASAVAALQDAPDEKTLRGRLVNDPLTAKAITGWLAGRCPTS